MENRSLPVTREHDDITMWQGGAPRAQATWAGQREAPGDWQRVLLAVTRHRWLVLLVTLLGTAAGLIATRFLEPRYRARAVLWIDAAAAREAPRDLIAADGVVKMSGWTELVGSNVVLDSVVRQLRLYLRPHSPEAAAALAGFEIRERVRPGEYRLTTGRGGGEFQLAVKDGPVIGRAAPGDMVGAELGFRWVPPAALLARGNAIEFEVIAPYDAARRLARSLDVQLDLAGNFLRIQLDGRDPERTTATVNAIASRVVTMAAELKRRKFEELAVILGEQQAHAERTLRSVEAALTDFRVRSAGVLQDQTPALSLNLDTRGDPAFARSFELRLSMDQLRRDRRAIEEVLAEIPRSGLRLDALSAIGAVQQSRPLQLALDETVQKHAEIRALSDRYTAESAPVQQRQAELETLERRAVPHLARQLVADLAAREAALAPQVDSAFDYLRRVPPLALEEARLERDVASAATLFTGIQQRHEAAQVALISSLPDIRILDAAAEPHEPLNSYAPLLVALSFITSLGLVVFGVTVRDRVDPKVRYPEQITDGMRLDILGALPHVSRRRRPGNGSSPVEVIEALRGMRLRLLHARADDGPLVLTVTSPAPGEGKSFLSVNLALSFAYAGYETLLIDGDVRRGVQHHLLAAALRPGLTDVLAGRAVPAEAVQATRFTGLSFLSSGTRMHNAPELLLSPALTELLNGTRKIYRVIIVDSPPLSSGADALMLAAVTGNVLLVLRSGSTNMPLAVSRLDALDALPVRTVGAVLNDVSGSSAFRYYTYDLTDYALPGADRRPEVIGGAT